DTLFAPELFGKKKPSQFASLDVVDSGTPVVGHITDGNGPVEGARILLRAGALPSTVGTSGKNGEFKVGARAGLVSVIVLPPAGAHLPEAVVTEAVGVPNAPPSVSLDFQWSAPAVSTLSLTVRASDDTLPGQPVRLRLETEPGALPN